MSIDNSGSFSSLLNFSGLGRVDQIQKTFPVQSYLAMLSRSIVLFLQISFLLISGCSTEPPILLIDGTIEYQTIEGWGINHFIEWDWEGPGGRYPISEKNVLLQIKKDLGIDFIHIYQGGLYEKVNDDNDPFHFNWEKYNSQFGDHQVVFERLKEIQDSGLVIVMKGGNHKPQWMVDENGDFDSRIPNIYNEFAEYWAAVMIYGKKEYNLNIPYIVMQQEPDFHKNCNFTDSELRDSIKTVGTRLRQHGFNTMIVAPDTGNAESAKEMVRTILLDPLASSYITNIAYHAYDGFSLKNGPDAAIPALISLAGDSVVKNSGLPLWMTEWCIFYDKRMRDYVDTLKLALDFAKMVYNTHVYSNTTNFVIWTSTYDWGYDKDGNGKQESEGIFGPGITNGKLNLKKYGHILSQYTKFIPPQSKRIHARLSGASNVFVTAYKNLNTGTFTIEAINKNKHAVNLTVKVDNIQGLSNLRVIRTAEKENSVELTSITLKNNAFAATLTGLSLTTFTGHFISH